MVVNRNRHDLLGLILTDHILIELGLDLVRSRNVLDIKSRFFRLLTLFLDLLGVGDATHVHAPIALHAIHVKEPKVRESSVMLVELIHKVWIV